MSSMIQYTLAYLYYISQSKVSKTVQFQNQNSGIVLATILKNTEPELWV